MATPNIWNVESVSSETLDEFIHRTGSDPETSAALQHDHPCDPKLDAIYAGLDLDADKAWAGPEVDRVPSTSLGMARDPPTALDPEYAPRASGAEAQGCEAGPDNSEGFDALRAEFEACRDGTYTGVAHINAGLLTKWNGKVSPAWTSMGPGPRPARAAGSYTVRQVRPIKYCFQKIHGNVITGEGCLDFFIRAERINDRKFEGLSWAQVMQGYEC